MILLRPVAAVVLSCAAVASCGTNPEINDYQSQFSALGTLFPTHKSGATNIAALDPNAVATLRNTLQADRQPITLVMHPSLKYTNLMAPYGQNGDVQTWASMHYETVALRQGLLVATRGFGPDLMSSTGPSVAQISAGHGTTNRRYFYLDGGDQPHEFDYTCTLATAGAESVTVLGKPFATRKISESCVGPQGSFVNQYWFDHGTNLRQSRQMAVPGLESLVLQRVID